MIPKYAKDQPAGFTNRIERIAIIGAGGQSGKYITRELLNTGKHTVTALTRPNSKSEFPEGINITRVDYDNELGLVSALQGQQFLVIILSVNAPKGLHSIIVQSAAKAGVPYVMPNCYGSDISNEKLARETFVGIEYRAHCDEIEATGTSSWIALVCSLWYEYSLAMGPEWFGFDFKAKKLTLYDDGSTKINVSTWSQCARSIAALVGLKELPEDEYDTNPTVSGWRNKPLYISSFLINQKEMFESWKRVTGDQDEEWTVECEPVDERYNQGLSLMSKGDRRGFALAMFVRLFDQNGDGNYESKYGLANTALRLPKEDLDERTKVAKDMLDNEYSLWVMDRMEKVQ